MWCWRCMTFSTSHTSSVVCFVYCDLQHYYVHTLSLPPPHLCPPLLTLLLASTSSCSPSCTADWKTAHQKWILHNQRPCKEWWDCDWSDTVSFITSAILCHFSLDCGSSSSCVEAVFEWRMKQITTPWSHAVQLSVHVLQSGNFSILLGITARL